MRYFESKWQEVEGIKYPVKIAVDQYGKGWTVDMFGGVFSYNSFEWIQ